MSVIGSKTTQNVINLATGVASYNNLKVSGNFYLGGVLVNGNLGGGGSVTGNIVVNSVTANTIVCNNGFTGNVCNLQTINTINQIYEKKL